MTIGTPNALAVPAMMQDEKEHRRKLSNTLNLVLSGKLNVTGTVTLTASAASTVLNDIRIGTSTFIGLMPTTANAAGALATTYIGTRGNGTATITHANNAQADKTFVYLAIG